MSFTITRPKRRIEIMSQVRTSDGIFISKGTREAWRGPQSARAVRVELHRVRQSGRFACAVIDGTVVLDGQLEGWLR